MVMNSSNLPISSEGTTVEAECTPNENKGENINSRKTDTDGYGFL